MAYTAKDILVMEKSLSDTVLLDMKDETNLTESQRLKLLGIREILGGLTVTLDDELDAMLVALEEIRDR